MSHSLGLVTYKQVLVRIVFKICLMVVVKNLVVVIIFPVDAIGVNILKVLVISWMDTSWAILDHAKEKHITRAMLMLTTYGDSMVVPCLSPFKGIKKEVVVEPYVSIRVMIQPLMKLQVLKEKFPLCTKAICQISPQAFNAYIMNTPKSEHLSAI